MDNTILLCRTCNLMKGTKGLGEFLSESGSTALIIESKLNKLADIQRWAEVELKRVLKRNMYKKFPNNPINSDS